MGTCARRAQSIRLKCPVGMLPFSQAESKAIPDGIQVLRQPTKDPARCHAPHREHTARSLSFFESSDASFRLRQGWIRLHRATLDKVVPSLDRQKSKSRTTSLSVRSMQTNERAA